jgi:hypothetical protein
LDISLIIYKEMVMKRTSIFILFLLIALMFLAFNACGDGKKQETETTTVATTEISTVETSEVTAELETEESTTKAPETTMPKPQPTKPQPTEPKPTQPSGGGLDTWNEEPLDPGGYVQDPNTDAQYWVDKEVEELGENLNWELY